ncbi:MAG: hypothetical protein ACLP1D_23535 [Xanthobacteraceae bacterium]
MTLTEIEFEHLLDRVGDAMAPGRAKIADAEPTFAALTAHLPVPANDNDNAGAWPLLAFPAGWAASC